MTIGQRLREERERIGMNQTTFAELGGVQKGAQIAYEQGKSSPTADHLVAAYERGVDVLYVLTGRREPKRQAPAVLPTTHDDPKAQAPALLPPGTDHPVRPDTPQPGAPGASGTSRVQGTSYALTAAPTPAHQKQGAPLVLAVGAGGTSREYMVIRHITETVCAGRAPGASGGTAPGTAQQTDTGPLAFERSYMLAALGRSDGDFATLTVEGDSMVPTLQHGDLVAIDTQVRRVNVSGVYVLRFDGDLTVKRVTKKSDGSLVISSDNPAYSRADEHFTRDQAATLDVIGRMVWPRVR